MSYALCVRWYSKEETIMVIDTMKAVIKTIESIERSHGDYIKSYAIYRTIL